MKNFKSFFGRYFLLFFLVLFAGAVILNACKKDDDDDEVIIPTTPELPPQDAFVMDFKSFNESQNNEKTIQNWGVAVTKIAVWNIALTVTLAVPVASYGAALSQKPVYQGEKTWLWSYDFNIGLKKYTAKLYGKLMGEEVEWKMYISGTLFNDFLWYEGKSRIDRTSGTWKFYHKPSDATQYLNIEWSRDITASTASIKYTVTSGELNGSSITYGKTLDLDYNAFYEIMNKIANNNVMIKWNILNKNGRIKDPAAFNDENWHCWSNTLHDVDCDPAK